MATGWKFRFSDERVSYLKELLTFAVATHAEAASSGTNNGFARMAHRFSGEIARDLLEEITNATG